MHAHPCAPPQVHGTCFACLHTRRYADLQPLFASLDVSRLEDNRALLRILDHNHDGRLTGAHAASRTTGYSRAALAFPMRVPPLTRPNARALVCAVADFEGPVRARLEALDTNGDGVVTLSEFFQPANAAVTNALGRDVANRIAGGGLLPPGIPPPALPPAIPAPPAPPTLSLPGGGGGGGGGMVVLWVFVSLLCALLAWLGVRTAIRRRRSLDTKRMLGPDPSSTPHGNCGASGYQSYQAPDYATNYATPLSMPGAGAVASPVHADATDGGGGSTTRNQGALARARASNGAGAVTTSCGNAV